MKTGNSSLTDSQNSVSPLSCIKLGGAFIALCIGSGYATGQEILQFFTSFGYWGIAAAVISFLIYLFTSTLFFKDGKRVDSKYQNKIFTYYFGSKVGAVFDWFSAIFLYALFIVMLSGAGSIFNEYYHLPNVIGAVIIGVLSVMLVCLGLTKVVDVIGFIGPVIIVFTIIVSILSLISNFSGLADVPQLIKTLPLAKSCPSWWLSGILYPSFAFFIIAPCLPPMGSTTSSEKEAGIGALAGVVGFHAAIVLAVLAMLANLPAIAGKQVPMLALAASSSPVISILFSIIILLGIFSSAVPFLYSAVTKAFSEGTRQMKISALILGILAIICGTYLPLDVLVNKVYASSGYIGAAVTLVLAVKILVKKFGRSPKSNDNPKNAE